MTYEEAIERIKRLHCWGIGNECAYHMDKRGKCSNCEIGMSIEAFEKQIPKKPIHGQNCMVCDTFNFRHRNYCFNCGQAIDWSEE